MSEWKTICISDLGKVVTGKTPKTSIPQNYGGKIPFLTPSDNLDGKTVLTTAKTLTKLGVAEVKNCLLPADSICVSCIGSDLGKVIMTDKETVTNQQFNSIIPNEEYCPDFIYYLMIIVGRKLNFLSKTSTAIPIINKTTFSNFEIQIPKDLSTQRKIAGILGALDDKIELNRRINANLEEQAQALFKSWFVDFETFKDSPFVDSELGRIPQGWRVGILSEIGDIIGGGTPSKIVPEYYADKGIAWITPKDLSTNNCKFTSRGETDISELGYKNSSAKLMPRGSILFSSRAPIGYISIAKNEICTNQGFKSIIPRKAGTCFIYYLLRANILKIESMASGSTFKEASGGLMKSLEIVIPPDELLTDFENIVQPLFNMQEHNEEENKQLSTLRDTLLPKLMKGEIKIN